MIESPKPWDGVEQPKDGQYAGRAWYTIVTYKIHMEGLETLLEETDKVNLKARDLGLKNSPYQGLVDRIKVILDEGKDKLSAAEKQGSRTILEDGKYYGNLRLIKAGLLLLTQRHLERKSTILQNDENLTPKLLEATIKECDEIIDRLHSLAEKGMLKGLKPAEIYFELTDPSKKQRTIGFHS